MGRGFLLRLFERSITIQISNETRDVTLINPRTYFFSGYCSTAPSLKISPGSTESCEFSNAILRLRGCVGLLVYEAETFTLAILFSNPFDRNLYYVEFAMEISCKKVHLGKLEPTYHRMYSGQAANVGEKSTFQRVRLGTSQEAMTVSEGNIKVMATMANDTQSTIKVLVANKD